MADFREAFKNIQHSVVGIGIRHDPDFEILGSGSIIHPDGWILTNRHVLEPLLETEKQAIRSDASVFLFLQNRSASEFKLIAGIGIASISEITFPLEEAQQTEEQSEKSVPKFRDLEPTQVLNLENPDIGLCRIDPRQVPSHILPLRPVKIVDSGNITEGTPVGVLGFPQGLYIPEYYESISQIQLAPLLQVGTIAGILPFSGDQKPSSFVLDMIINPGSSGSPLFLSNGNVVGLVYATRLAYTPLHVLKQDGEKPDPLKEAGVYIPTGLGLAIPSAQLPTEWLTKDNHSRKKHKPK